MGQLNNYFMTMMTLNWKDPSTLRRNHEKTGKQMNNSETVFLLQQDDWYSTTWQPLSSWNPKNDEYVKEDN